MPHKKFPKAADGFKFCRICDAQKPLHDFRTSPNVKDGRSSYCLRCEADRGKLKYAQRMAEMMARRPEVPGGTAAKRVYVMSSGSFCKVGVARAPTRRRLAVQTGCPTPVELAYQSDPMDSLAAHAVERQVHDALRGYAAQGEWFGVDAETAITLAKKVVLFS